MKTKFIFWYWKENQLIETDQDSLLDSVLNEFLKTENIPRFVYQQLKLRDQQLLIMCNNLYSTKIVYFAPEECRLFLPGFLNTLIPVLKNNNLKLELWIGNFEETQNMYTIGVDCLDDNITVVNWWQQLMFESYYYYKHKHLDHNVNFDKAFISLNNRITKYRCLLIDKMAEHNLLNYGYVSWLKHLDEGLYDNEFKYFDNRVIKLEDTNNITLNEEIVESSYFKGFVNIITEGDINFKDISEKTFYAILHKKPFLILGATGIHQTLSNLGFKLYSDVFDYSFDSSDNIEFRIDGIIKNIKNIIDSDYNMLYKNCLETAEFNYNRYIEILKDPTSINNAYLDYLKIDLLTLHERYNLESYQRFFSL
jgi:hypothetical protein